MIWCWCVVGDRARDVDHQSEVIALDVVVRADRYTNLYTGHEFMWVNYCYKNYSNAHAYHFINVVVICMIDVS